MEYIGGASGAVLGYIHGNRRGGVLGYQIGRKLSQMAPVKRTKRKTPITPTTPRKMKSKYNNKENKSKRTPGIVRRKRNDESSGANRAAKVKNRYKKSVSMKAKKKVKITSDFRAKVSKALSPKSIKGKYVEMSTGGITLSLANGNKQTYGVIGNQLATNRDQLLFSPSFVLDCASVLFQNKPASQSAKYSVDLPAQVYNFGSLSFDSRTVKIHVRNSYASHVFRNNTNRTLIIALYECAPKLNMNILDEGDVVAQWQDSMTNETFNNLSRPINIAAATPGTLYMTPMFNKMLMQKWSFERHDIILDPGQTYDHFMQGPSDVTYDFAKFWKSDSTGEANKFYDLQKKFTRQLMYVVRPDIVQSGIFEAGRFGIPDAQGKLLVEWKHYVHLEAPEQTGVTHEVAAPLPAIYPRSLMRDCYFFKHWFESAQQPALRTEVQTGQDNQ